MTSERPVVVDYRRDWPERAANLIGVLADSVGRLAPRIEHIGRTAIPGMAAKDVLDLQASVADLDGAARTLDAPLAALGFRRPIHEADHVPAGRSDPPARWAKRLWLRRGHREGDVNLHVRLTGSANERVALLFRDWFRAHPDAVPAYAAFKLALAQATPDFDSYTGAKDPVVDLVIVVAEAWATSLGWQP